MSGSALSSSFKKRPISSSLAIGSTCERPVRKQTIEDTLEPLPRPGGSSARAVSGPRTSAATSRASSSMS